MEIKRIVAAVIALVVGGLLGYCGIGIFMDKYFKGRIIDIVLLIIIISLLIAMVGIGLKIADHFFDLFPKE